MQTQTLDQFIADKTTPKLKGPVAVIFVEDLTEVDTTLRHHLQLGFRTTIVLATQPVKLPGDIATRVIQVVLDARLDNIFVEALNRIITAIPDRWFYFCYNAEYLFFPFCETRSVGEMLTFHTEERRDAMLTYVVDLYAEDLGRFPNAVSLEHALLDRSGYYALARPDPENHNHPKERQLDFFGGLRWRYEEHIPADRRKIDRIALFRSKPGLRLSANHVFNDEEYNTYSCPWHHNLTAAICSFRTAKALKSNPGSTHEIQDFTWHNSVPFDWTSQQLLDLGLMEPGQWF